MITSPTQEQENTDIDDPMAPVTSVSQLRDVQPTDWTFQALQSLLKRYGVIAGYQKGIYRGNRGITRYEFAAGLCIMGSFIPLHLSNIADTTVSHLFIKIKVVQ